MLKAKKGMSKGSNIIKPVLLGIGYPYGSRPKGCSIHLDFHGLQNTHLVATGGSGSGKTALLYNLSTQIMALAFPVVIIFDPHGDLHNHLLNFLVQYPLPEIAERLVLIEPYVSYIRGQFVGINVLETEEGQEPYELVDEQVSCYKVIWKESWGERMASILRNSFQLLQEFGLTLIEMPWLLMDKDFRDYLASQTSNEDLKEYFRFFSQFKSQEQHLFVESARSRSESFVQNPYVKPILGQARSTIKFTELINRPGTIILVNASRNHLKTESRRLFCSLLFSKLHAAILARENIPEKERIPLFIFIDEAQEVYYPEAFLSILEGGRKFNAHFGGIFHQTLSQFEDFGDKDLEVVLANTGVKCVFQVNRKDAERYAKEAFKFTGSRVKYEERDIWGSKGRPVYFSIQEEMENTISELMHQRRREMYIQLKDGRSETPYVATTPTIVYPQQTLEKAEAIRDLVYQRYARSSEEVMGEIANRRQRLQAEMKMLGQEMSTKPTKPTNKASELIKIIKR